MLKNLIKKLTALAIIISFVAFSAVLYESEFMYGYKGSSVVMLTNGSSGGTGFRVKAPSGDTFILTNAHICKIAPVLTATQGDLSREIKVIEIYQDHDLCIMEDVEEIPALSVASSLSKRERVWLVGHPALRPLTLESGHFVGTMNIELWTRCSVFDINLQFKKYEKKTEITLEDLEAIIYLAAGYCLKGRSANHINNISYGGNSGSPVLNKWGNLVGVLFAGQRGQPTASYTVPLEVIQRFLEDK